MARKPDFAAAQMRLSHMSMAEGEVDAGITWCEKALASQPDDAGALSNYGFMLMLKGDFKGAIVKLDRSYTASPGLLTPLVLSDVYRLTGDYATALTYSRNAMQMVVNPNLRDPASWAANGSTITCPLQRTTTKVGRMASMPRVSRLAGVYSCRFTSMR